MSDLTDLYQEMIIDHSRRPRNRRAQPSPPARQAEGHNPLCGDRVTVYITLEGDRIADVSFEGAGCAISTASASLMTGILKGRTIEEARQLFDCFHDLVTGKEARADGVDIGKLEVFSGVSEYPVRVKCATLAWHTLNAAIEGRDEPVSTE
jgi:nitrogen fixation protein NifU and related proteins